MVNILAAESEVKRMTFIAQPGNGYGARWMVVVDLELGRTRPGRGIFTADVSKDESSIESLVRSWGC